MAGIQGWVWTSWTVPALPGSKALRADRPRARTARENTRPTARAWSRRSGGTSHSRSAPASGTIAMTVRTGSDAGRVDMCLVSSQNLAARTAMSTRTVPASM